ncbi:hypothetical protein DEO72_LG2g2969 [Vigna unguiculata]|uniref:Uncharacterized protein n=1 Tax=Vigna unguiculata TaxID=3917 RepID=A0A4D6L2B5_VIGUN|nr:hypothetical protein DEO72_LG2g2969 [Vigna unguiculata]
MKSHFTFLFPKFRRRDCAAITSPLLSPLRCRRLSAATVGLSSTFQDRLGSTSERLCILVGHRIAGAVTSPPSPATALFDPHRPLHCLTLTLVLVRDCVRSSHVRWSQSTDFGPRALILWCVCEISEPL